MDPLSGVASVVAVIQLTQLICGALKVYFHSVREARADIDRIFTTMKSLEQILTQAERIAKYPYSNDVESFLVDFSGPVRQLRTELENIRMQLVTPSLRGRLGVLAQSLRWPFQTKEVERSINIIEQHKSTLSAILGFEILDLQINHLDIVTSIQQDIKQAQDCRDRMLLIQWLAKSIPDPSREHNAIRSDHVENTGSWLTDSEELRYWSRTRNSFLWLNGGPGSGKSMLSSTVIESLKSRCRRQKHCMSAVTYWYFSFARPETQNISNVLCSVARDLCSKVLKIPKVAEELWSDGNNGQQRPAVSDLLSILRALLPSFDHVYLVIDAIDEYPRPQRDRLLRTIQNITSMDAECLHLMVVSRPETDIQISFQEIARTAGGYREVKAQGPRVRRDIEKYLNHRLHSTPFRNWSANERENIRSILLSQADDMFRLVSLQLERLSALLSRVKRRQALKLQPKTLDHFYDRALEDIDDVNRDILKRALDWLLLSARPLRVAELAEAVIVSPSRPFFDPEERFDNEQCILTILPGAFVKILPELGDHEAFGQPYAQKQNDKRHRNLARRSPIIQLAHHSVKDYLLSNRVARQDFKVDCVLASSILKNTCMAYMVYVAGATLPLRQDHFREFTLLEYVSTCWPHHVVESDYHDKVLAQHITAPFSQSLLGETLTQEGTTSSTTYLIANEPHFSCSRGAPCGQCRKFTLPRQWAMLQRFNNSRVSQLELLSAFIIPKYLTGHITQANVEQAVSQHGTSWGKQEILIRMGWGYEKPLEARVVALILPSQSQLGYQHQAVGPNFKRPELVRKKSPPLGIPLASFEDMKAEYRNMVRDIVMGDLESYVEVPYDNQESELPEHLLGIICTFYRAGLAAGQECELLREVIAIHVISTILERSLILDDDSLRRVEKHLNDSFPRPSAANCVQRQIKFALFLAQRERVSQVLEDWGHMMWSSSKGMNVEQKWATSFSVLVMLILVVDKMIEAADLFCRGEVQHHGADALAERRAFEELVRLTQRELFERCKEIFHSSFKTRKGGKEACNPIRDGLSAFRGRPVPEGISRLVWDLKNAHRVYGSEIRSQWTTRASIEGAEYGNAGRLASVFLGDFIV